MKCPHKSSVYVFAEADSEFIKIGVAYRPVFRLEAVQCCNPRSLSLAFATTLMMREIAEQVEFRSHSVLSNHRVRGEWFKCDLATAIAVIEAAITYVHNKRGELGYAPSIKRSRTLGNGVSL